MSTVSRVLQTERLDGLAGDDPRALRSRRDLVRINVVMRQSAIMATLLLSSGAAPRRIADLGSGDGRFLLAVARRLAPHWSGVTALVVDRQNIVSDETRRGFETLGWRCETRVGDVFDALPQLDAEVITANLFLHHLDDASLRRLLVLASSRARAFVVCEPRRSQSALLASRFVFALACNEVTRHDAVASVRAGFAGRELSRVWPAGAGWTLFEGPASPFTHQFLAHREV